MHAVIYVNPEDDVSKITKIVLDILEKKYVE